MFIKIIFIYILDVFIFKIDINIFVYISRYSKCIWVFRWSVCFVRGIMLISVFILLKVYLFGTVICCY